MTLFPLQRSLQRLHYLGLVRSSWRILHKCQSLEKKIKFSHRNNYLMPDAQEVREGKYWLLISVDLWAEFSVLAREGWRQWTLLCLAGICLPQVKSHAWVSLLEVLTLTSLHTPSIHLQGLVQDLDIHSAIPPPNHSYFSISRAPGWALDPTFRWLCQDQQRCE